MRREKHAFSIPSDRREVSDIGQLSVSVHCSVFVNICKPMQYESGTVVAVCCAGDRSVRFKSGLCDEGKLGEKKDVMRKK